jgi:DNA-binding NtrC family response regulator
MKPLRILVAHRDPLLRDELAGLLRQGHHTIVVAQDAGNAAELLGSDVEAVVLDLGLPELDVATLRQALSPAATPEPDSLHAAERRHLALVLHHTAGNKRKAALILGISRSTLLNKVRKYRLEDR